MKILANFSALVKLVAFCFAFGFVAGLCTSGAVGLPSGEISVASVTPSVPAASESPQQ